MPSVSGVCVGDPGQSCAGTCPVGVASDRRARHGGTAIGALHRGASGLSSSGLGCLCGPRMLCERPIPWALGRGLGTLPYR